MLIIYNYFFSSSSYNLQLQSLISLKKVLLQNVEGLLVPKSYRADCKLQSEETISSDFIFAQDTVESTL